MERIAVPIVQIIRKTHDLDSKTSVSRFWRISNLILKEYKETTFNGDKAHEVICEHDLDFVKEEKRVVNNDEFLREHHINKVIFDNEYKLLKYF